MEEKDVISLTPDSFSKETPKSVKLLLKAKAIKEANNLIFYNKIEIDYYLKELTDSLNVMLTDKEKGILIPFSAKI